jgi:imidazolonepropionase-like amidohydrolase
MKCLVQYAGFTPEVALSAATREPAKILKINDRIGTIEEGKNVDLLLLDENPLKDINATEKISVIILTVNSLRART